MSQKRLQGSGLQNLEKNSAKKLAPHHQEWLEYVDSNLRFWNQHFQLKNDGEKWREKWPRFFFF
jgi:hypothetical protein